MLSRVATNTARCVRRVWVHSAASAAAVKAVPNIPLDAPLYVANSRPRSAGAAPASDAESKAVPGMTKTYNTLKMLVAKGRGRDAMLLFGEMQREGNVACQHYLRVMNIVDVKTAERLHSHMHRSGIVPGPNTIHLLICKHADAGNVDDIKRLLKYCVFELQDEPYMSSYERLIQTTNCDCAGMLALLKDIGLPLDAACFEALVRTCVRQTDHRGLNVLEELIPTSIDVKDSARVLSALAMGYGRLGNMVSMTTSLHRMPSNATGEAFATLLKALPEDTVCSKADGMALAIANEMYKRQLEWTKLTYAPEYADEVYFAAVRACSQIADMETLSLVWSHMGKYEKQPNKNMYSNIISNLSFLGEVEAVENVLSYMRQCGRTTDDNMDLDVRHAYNVQWFASRVVAKRNKNDQAGIEKVLMRAYRRVALSLVHFYVKEGDVDGLCDVLTAMKRRHMFLLLRTVCAVREFNRARGGIEPIEELLNCWDYDGKLLPESDQEVSPEDDTGTP